MIDCSRCLKEDVCDQKVWVVRLTDAISKIELQGSNQIHTMDEVINLFGITIDTKCSKFYQKQIIR